MKLKEYLKMNEIINTIRVKINARVMGDLTIIFFLLFKDKIIFLKLLNKITPSRPKVK